MKSKILLMGRSNVGKTSIRCIVFGNFMPSQANSLTPTIDVESSHTDSIGSLQLNIWDCGGQDTFMEQYLYNRSEVIFGDVEMMVYVFDISSKKTEEDIYYFQLCSRNLIRDSPSARIFCLLHKMDLIESSKRTQLLQEKQILILESLSSENIQPVIFGTSIWEDTLYRAWSSILHSLIPDIQLLEDHLTHCTDLLNASEVYLLDRCTLLVIAHYKVNDEKNIDNFEKISNVLKHFQLSCRLFSEGFENIEFQQGTSTTIVNAFTRNSYIVIVYDDTIVSTGLMNINIDKMRNTFQRFDHDSRQRFKNTEAGIFV